MKMPPHYKESHNFWGGKMVEHKTSKPIKTYNLSDLEHKFNLKFNTLVMDIEGGEVEVIEELNLIRFDKLLFDWVHATAHSSSMPRGAVVA